MISRTNFYYDPIRQGYDTNLWHTIFGVPAIVAGNRLSANNAAIVHYGDIMKGEFTFNLYVPDAPGGNDSRIIGLYEPSTSAYIVFTIGTDLSGDVSNGSDTATTGAITWDSSWTGVNTNFRIRWEAGTAKFFVGDTQVGAISDVAVPAGPLSLYISDVSGTTMTVGDISAKNIQTYILNPKSGDTTVYGGAVIVAQGVTVSENLSIVEYNYIPENTESVTVTENVSLVVSSNESLNESITVTENLSINVGNYAPSVFEEVTVTENLNMYKGGENVVSVFDSITVTEDPVVSI